MKDLSFFEKIVFWVNVLAAILLFLACFATYVPVELFSVLFVFSLAAPFLVALNVLFVLYWLFRKKKQIWLSIFVLILGYFLQDSYIKIFRSNNEISTGDLSLLTYNTLEFEGRKRGTRNLEITKNIKEFILSQDPDIVCFQEFDRSQVQKHNFDQYPYNYFNYNRYVQNGIVLQAIYSKYPIINSGNLNFSDSANGAIFSDIVVKKDTIRVYNIHLQSLKVRPGNFKRELPQRLLKRLGAVFIKQQHQAELVKEHARNSRYRKIICGDFNNTQFSNVYWVLKDEMHDTFAEKGFGYGRTYNFKFLPFRIDFILADKSFDVMAHKNYEVEFSDHFPVMASFRLKQQ